MRTVWQKIGFIACVGFTAIMAGANLAHMSSSAQGSPVDIFGVSIPQRLFMSVAAVCVDAVIVISPFAIGKWNRENNNSALFVSIAIWLLCSGWSINSLHDWFADSATNAAIPAEQAAKKQAHNADDLKRARDRLDDIQRRLLKVEDRDQRRILKEEEKETKASISDIETADLKTVVATPGKANDSEHWVKAFAIWFISVGCWILVFGSDGSRDEKLEKWDGKHLGKGVEINLPNGNQRVPLDAVPSQPSQHLISPPPGKRAKTVREKPVETASHPEARPENVVDLRPKDGMERTRLSEAEAIEVALRMRQMTPPAPWPKIAEETGWPQSSIHRKAAGKGVR